MDPGVILVIAVIAYLIGLWIMYEIIKSATQSTKQTELLEAQTRLLAELLKKHGVSDESLLEITNLQNKYFTKNVQPKS
jgi:hypothetical protein